MITTLLAGAAVAISFSAPPGPVSMETVRRGLRGGFGPALNVQLGSIIGDMAWCLAALIGLAPLVQIGLVRLTLGVVGVGLLVYLGATGVRDAFQQTALAPASHVEIKPGAFRNGMAISLANPQAVGYWLSVGGALVASGAVGRSPAQTAGFVAGFLGGAVAVLGSIGRNFGAGMSGGVAFLSRGRNLFHQLKNVPIPVWSSWQCPRLRTRPGYMPNWNVTSRLRARMIVSDFEKAQFVKIMPRSEPPKQTLTPAVVLAPLAA